ncbi:MAG: Gfo/Idh/MocA family oxidoreductase [Candidatus Cloacimonetes bacterium]|nr:Gfo/Idh/MocA family oxidoreductase [Candidatus Cloacimonadota bacterium]
MITVAVVGYGYWGPNLVRVWNNNNRANLKYVCDIQQDRVDLAKKNYRYVETTLDYHDVLRDPEVDALNIVTPIFTHFEIAEAALQSGKHILVEKPLTASSEEMKKLIAIARKQQRVMMVGHTFLYSPPVLKVKELIRAGELGQLDFIQLTRINLGKVKHDFNVIWDLAPHDFSILEFWLEELPLSIQVVGKASTFKQVCDVAYINLKYDHDILANIHLSWISPVKIRQSYIVGKKKMIVYDDVNTTEKIKLYDMGIDKINDPETFGEFQLFYRTGDISVPRLNNIEPLNAECNHFIDCIENNTVPRTDAEHALRIIRMIEAAQESLRQEGASIKI